MPKRAMLTIGGALAALLLLACGDDRLSPEEYFPQVQDVADDINGTVTDGADQLAGLDSAASEASLVEAVRGFFATLADALDDGALALNDLSASSPPADVEDAHYAFTAQASELAAAFRDVSDRLADAAGFDELDAVLGTLDASFGLSEDFLAACEGLEQAADDAGQPLDLQCDFELIPEDAFTAANPAAGYFAAMQDIADATNGTLATVAVAYTAALDEAATDAEIVEAIATFFRENALVMDAAAEEGEGLAPPDAVRAVHDAFIGELRTVASQFGEVAWRLGNVEGDLDEANAILEPLPETFGQPPEFLAACDALEGAAAEAGLTLELGCGGGQE